MNELFISGTGIIKFTQKFETEKGMIHTYLITVNHDEKSFSNLTLKQYTKNNDPLPIKTKIEFTGELRENRYKDKEGNWKSGGLYVKLMAITKE